MAILIDKNTSVLVQGITGRSGGLQTRTLIEYGTRVVAGVTPRQRWNGSSQCASFQLCR